LSIFVWEFRGLSSCFARTFALNLQRVKEPVGAQSQGVKGQIWHWLFMAVFFRPFYAQSYLHLFTGVGQFAYVFVRVVVGC
jgi:hypothetical protein